MALNLQKKTMNSACSKGKDMVSPFQKFKPLLLFAPV